MSHLTDRSGSATTSEGRATQMRIDYAEDEKLSSTRLLNNAIDAADVAEASVPEDSKTSRAWADISAAWSMAAKVALERENTQPAITTREWIGEDDGESFDNWTRQQIEKLGAAIRILENQVHETTMAVVSESTDDSANQLMKDKYHRRLIWCLMSIMHHEDEFIDDMVEQISPELWERSGNMSARITVNKDGSRTITCNES